MSASTKSIVDDILSVPGVLGDRLVGQDAAAQNNATPAKPPMYAIILHNDDSTNPRFVVNVLEAAFSINRQRAVQIMTNVHLGERGVVKIVSKDMADTQLLAARHMISGATPDEDFAVSRTRTGHCELTFTVELETKGDN